MIIYLSGEDIRAIHDVVLGRYGGLRGDKEPGSIDFMAEKPASELYGQELYPGLFFKAAVYMHGFATRQFFHDGNKRTAYVCAAVFLELNGFVVDVNDMELYETALLVANGGMTENALANWLETHSRME